MVETERRVATHTALALVDRHNVKSNFPDGTDLIAEHFAVLDNGGVCFKAPVDAAENWIPAGYELVTDPEHILAGCDCILPYLSTDWRLVANVNAGTRAGRRAADVGQDVRYVAKLNK